MTSLLNTMYRKLTIYRRRSLRFDVVAAFVVFLVAIPLCLGIAIATGTSFLSGILSGIIGGIIVGSLSGSAVSVSGPDAGMVVIMIAAITQLGDFNTFLLAVFLAGILQIIMGCLRAGFVADYVPSNVIQGLMCAIGILLIIKQLPLAFTHANDLSELKNHLLDTSVEGFSVTPLLNIAQHINQGAAIISLISFGMLVSFEKTTQSWLKAIPGAIVVVGLGVALNELFLFTNSSLIQDTPQLVNIPHTENFAQLLAQIQTPTWMAWRNPNVYFHAAILAIVASLETLLNIQAGEKLDKKHRHCSTDRELMAQGVGNVVAGLIGALPVTSVVVRTTVNIQTGARTKFSAILHGVFILFAVLLLPHALNKIPLSSLATVLIYTGYKLNRPKIYRDIYQQGWDRFIPFITTIIGIVCIDVLAGIIIGLAVSLFFILKTNSQARLDIIKERNASGVVSRLVLPQQITFLNKASLIAELNSIPNKSQLVIDARYSDYIDKEILELIRTYQNEKYPNRNIEVRLIGFKDRYDIHNYIDFIHVTTYPIQAQLSPHDVLLLLQEGNQRLLEDRRVHRSVKNDIQQTATAQHPIAIILGCIDSRVPVETVFDMSFGDLFCVRIAGNVINDDILASIEYGCNVVGAKLIVVLGHTHCGAIGAACDGVKKGHITQLLTKIKPALRAEKETPKAERNSENKAFVSEITQLNIANTLLHLYQDSPILQRMIDDKQIGMVGAIYDVNTGMAQFKSFANQIARLEQQEDHPLANTLREFLPND